MEHQHPLSLFRYCPVCGSPRFVNNNEKSRRCEDCGFVYYLNPSAATAAFIVNASGNVLVVRRKLEPSKGMLDLPGGFSDIGESLEQGVTREVKEETGLDVERPRFLFSYPNSYLYSGLVEPTMDSFFLCRVPDGVEAHADDDASEAFWARPEDLDASLFAFPSTRNAVFRFVTNLPKYLKK